MSNARDANRGGFPAPRRSLFDALRAHMPVNPPRKETLPSQTPQPEHVSNPLVTEEQQREVDAIRACFGYGSAVSAFEIRLRTKRFLDLTQEGKRDRLESVEVPRSEDFATLWRECSPDIAQAVEKGRGNAIWDEDGRQFQTDIARLLDRPTTIGKLFELGDVLFTLFGAVGVLDIRAAVADRIRDGLCRLLFQVYRLAWRGLKPHVGQQVIAPLAQKERLSLSVLDLLLPSSPPQSPLVGTRLRQSNDQIVPYAPLPSGSGP